ncbi:uncharacterized protein BJ212DRAFT_1263475, partial [Suillus subaureus]
TAGSYFNNQEDLNIVVQVGTPGLQGITEITDIIFMTQGPTAGTIVMEWNVHDPFDQQGAAGMWDSHIWRVPFNLIWVHPLIYGECPSGTYSSACFPAFLDLHITYGATALEGTWVWLADYDLDGFDQLTLFSGRGILSHSQGPVLRILWYVSYFHLNFVGHSTLIPDLHPLQNACHKAIVHLTTHLKSHPL